MKAFKKHLLWILLGVASGIICGGFGALFSKSVGLVTDFRAQHEWIIYLLPLGGIISVCIYKLFRIKNTGTRSVFECAKTEQDLPNFLAPAVFFGTCISHLFGASSGREGAALQIGGGVASVFAKLLKLDETSRRITVACGMAALFSAVFGTPLAAWIFVIEVVFVFSYLSAIIPILVSSITAFAISQLLTVKPERFNIGTLPGFSFALVWKAALITAASVVVAYLFCKGLSLGKKFAEKILKNEFLRIAVGGVIIVGFTLLVGNQDYNGGGINVIERVFEGSVKYEAFALKLIFTVICVCVGYKGGEIIPTLFIGATLGGTLALLLGLPIGTGAAIGMAVLFCSATKCPIATILLCCEMFGFSCAPLIIPIVFVCFLPSRKFIGLYGYTKDLLHFIKERKSAATDNK